MANSMMDSILALVTPEMQQSLAAHLGESAQAVQGGLGATTAAALGGLAAKAGDSGFLGQILNLASTANSQNVLGSLGSIASGGSAGGVGDLVNKFLPLVFGVNQGPVTGAISQQSGLGSAAVSGLFKVAVPLVLGFLGRAHANGTLSAASLGSMLKAEAPNLQGYLPAGVLGGLGAAAGSTVSAARTGASAAASAGSRWIVPLAILGALVLVWLLMLSMHAPTQVAQSAATTVGNAANSAWAALGEMVAVKLPDGTTLNAPTLGVESRLVTYLNDGTAVVTDETWFDFDRLLFDTGKATLQPQSQEQLGNIAAILKAYPKAKVRIGGYTDNTGDPAANLTLSQARADSVTAELAKLGVEASRLDAKGYGQEHTVADNTTEEGRQKNRRISLHVTEK
jgi:outer membrane protein OmpA-like peptidoglycan-associated protein